MAKNDIGSKAYFEFLGGQNSAAAPDNLSDNEARELRNMDVVVRGSARTRWGTLAVTWACFNGLTTERIVRKAEFSTTAGTLIKLALTSAGNLYRYDNTTPILTACGTHMDYTVYNNKMYILTKSSYYVYDGTTITEVTNASGDSQLATAKKCKYICARAERIYVAGNPDAPNTLYYSQVGDPTYFKTGTFMVQAASSDGDAISGLKEFNEALLVFKARGVWGWFGYSLTDDVKFVKLNIHNGTKAYRTVQNVNNLLFYLGDDGVYAMKGTYSGSIDTVKVSMNIDDRFKNLYMPTNGYDSSACAVYADGKYYLSYCVKTGEVGQDLTINNRIAVCHAAAGLESNKLPWTYYDNIYFCDALNSADGTVYFSKHNAAVLYKYDETVYDDLGVPFTFTVEGKDYDAGSPIHVKKYKEAWVVVNQDEEDDTVFDGSIFVDYAEVDYPEIAASESFIWDKGNWDEVKWDWSDTVTRYRKISKKGIRIRIKLTGTTSTEYPKNRLFLYGMAFRYKVKKPYKESNTGN